MSGGQCFPEFNIGTIHNRARNRPRFHLSGILVIKIGFHALEHLSSIAGVAF